MWSEIDAERRFGSTPPDLAIAEIAARQHGIVTIAQLYSAGLNESGVSRRVKQGRLFRISCGVYAVGHDGLSQEARWMVAVFACGPGAVLSHRSAAILWKVYRGLELKIDVLTTHRPRPRPAIELHRCRALDPRDVTTRQGIPVTTVPRLLVDLTDVMESDELTNVIDEAAYRNLFDLAATLAAMARATGRHRLPVLEEAIDAYVNGSAGTKSRYERAFLRLVESAGIEPPLVNTKVLGEEVDAHWPERRLVVEIDGPGHERPTRRRDDARRDRILTAAGWTVLRFTGKDVEQRPHEVLRRLTGEDVEQRPGEVIRRLTGEEIGQRPDEVVRRLGGA